MQAEPESAARTTPSAGDAATIVAVALVAYMLSNVLHEAAGHGGACLATGARALHVSSVDMECSSENRLVAAGGTLVNFAAAAVFLWLGRRSRGRAPAWRYFCWIAMTVNLFTASGYFLFSGVGGFGDWADFIAGLEPQWAWRAGMALFGAAAYAASVRLVLLEMRPLIGSDPKERYSRAVQLTRLPYFAGGILACIAGARNPAGMFLVAFSAAASTFGGASGLLWGPKWLRGSRIPPGAVAEPAAIVRHWGWIAAAAALACIWVLVLGPGVRFGQ